MSYYRRAIEKYAKYVIEQSKQNLKKPKKPFGQLTNTTGKLSNSLEYRIKGDKISFLSEDYGQFIDIGVRGSKSSYPQTAQAQTKAKEHFKFRTGPHSSVFDKWIKQKGIKGRDKKTGRFITNKSLTYLIARSIGQKGIRATLFFTKPFQRGLDLFGDEIAEGFIKDKIGIE
tara:strand:+ start:121 stop:636 length:516 start_codon:yes stop_codon:yes gene_type:complete